MNETEFDKFADEYTKLHGDSIAISGEGPEYFAEYKIVDILHEYKKSSKPNMDPLRLLDFGSGIGGSVPYVMKHIPDAELTCLDVSQRSLDIAKDRFLSLANFVHFDGVTIPFPTNHFDIAFAMCVFHHIEHETHLALLHELHRIIRPGGSLFVFEHNPNNPLTVRVVNSCVFDKNAKLVRASNIKCQILMVGFKQVNIRYRIFFPHFLKALRPLEIALKWLPLGGQYYAHAIK